MMPMVRVTKKRVVYCVAVWWKVGGEYGGIHRFEKASQAMKCAASLRSSGHYDEVDVWCEMETPIQVGKYQAKNQ